jgi:Protein of unknown function (DUF3570)
VPPVASESRPAAVAASSRSSTVLRRHGALVASLTLLTSAGPVLLDCAEDTPSELGVEFHSFQDSRGVTVQSPAFDLSRDFTDRTALRAKFGVDAISAASDSCARCHSQGVSSQRVYLGASLVRKLKDATVSVGGEYSHENFYSSTTIFTSGSRTFNKANTTVAGGFTFSHNRPILHPRTASESQTTDNAFVSLTQTLTRSTVAQVGYEFGYISGYQSDPFLRVLVNDQLVLGSHPDTRSRQTFTLRLRQALPAQTYFEADYRHYFDSWSLHSNSFSVGLAHQFTPEFLLHFGYRRYDQTGAYFWAPAYFGNPEFFTADFRLEPFTSNLFTGRTVFTPRNGIWFLPQGSGITAQYERYSSDTNFLAGIFTVRFSVPLGGKKLAPSP